MCRKLGLYSVLDEFNVVISDHFLFDSFQVFDMKLAVVEKALTLVPVSFDYRKFTDAKRCLRDLISTSCSNDTRTSSLEFALVFDDYNPFCEGSSDLGKIITYNRYQVFVH